MPAGWTLLDRAVLAVPAPEAAPALLNKLLVAADGRAGRIIEVEAYGGPPGQEHRPGGGRRPHDRWLADPAAHSFRGPTARNATMFGPPGHLYVYFSYGVHWCANVATSPEGVASAVLLRAVEPVGGVDLMRAARWRGQRSQVDRDLCRGPGRLAQAFGIDRGRDGVDLCDPASPLVLASDGTPPPDRPGVSPRVGISQARDVPWRFFVAGHPMLSGRRRPPGDGPAGPAVEGEATPGAEHQQDSLDR